MNINNLAQLKSFDNSEIHPTLLVNQDFSSIKTFLQLRLVVIQRLLPNQDFSPIKSCQSNTSRQSRLVVNQDFLSIKDFSQIKTCCQSRLVVNQDLFSIKTCSQSRLVVNQRLLLIQLHTHHKFSRFFSSPVFFMRVCFTQIFFTLEFW